MIYYSLHRIYFLINILCCLLTFFPTIVTIIGSGTFQVERASSRNKVTFEKSALLFKLIILYDLSFRFLSLSLKLFAALKLPSHIEILKQCRRLEKCDERKSILLLST